VCLVVTLSENEKTQPRATLRIKCRVKLNQNATEIYEKLRWVYGKHTLSRTQVLSGIKHFRLPWVCGSRISFWNNLHFKNQWKYNQREFFHEVCSTFQIRIIGSELNLNHQTVHDILTEEFVMRALRLCVTFPLTLPSTWSRFWTKAGIALVPTPLNTQDLIPYEFFLFPKFKFHLFFHHFGTAANIQNVVTYQLRAVPHEDF
jgi:hypothetical protein